MSLIALLLDAIFISAWLYGWHELHDACNSAHRQSVMRYERSLWQWKP